MVVVAGDEHDLRVAEPLADGAEHGLGGGHRVAQGTVAQLEHVAEQDEAIGALHALQQRVEGDRPAQHVDAAARAEVQVGDHEGAHADGR
jgi:hypothetical protein